MVKTKKFQAIVIMVLSVLCLNLSIIGFGSTIKSQLNQISNLSSEILGIFDLGSFSNFDYLEEALEEANENATIKKVTAVSESLDDAVDTVLSGSLSLLDIRAICLLPGDILDVVADASIALGADKDYINDGMDSLYESSPALSIAQNIATGILVYVALMVLCAIFNIVSILLNRKGLPWVMVVLWAIAVLVMLFPVVIFMSDGGYFAFQVGPILGLALAIVAMVFWKKEYHALAGSGATMEQPWSCVVDTAKNMGAQASAKASAAKTTAATPVVPTPTPAPATSFCASCGNPIAADKAFCSNCGTPVAPVTPKVFCGNCGAERNPESKFCGNCGASAEN